MTARPDLMGIEDAIDGYDGSKHDESAPATPPPGGNGIQTHREDGWPLCPRCGEDFVVRRSMDLVERGMALHACTSCRWEGAARCDRQIAGVGLCDDCRPAPAAAEQGPSLEVLASEVLRLDAEATPGEWRVAARLCDGRPEVYADDGRVVRGPVAQHMDEADAALIAYYRNNFPVVARAVLSSPAVPRNAYSDGSGDPLSSLEPCIHCGKPMRRHFGTGAYCLPARPPAVPQGLTEEERERIGQIEKRLSAATPRPWSAEHRQDDGKYRIVHNMRQDWPQDPVCWIGWNQARRDADATLIAAAPTDIDYLLGLVKRLSLAAPAAPPPAPCAVCGKAIGLCQGIECVREGRVYSVHLECRAAFDAARSAPCQHCGTLTPFLCADCAIDKRPRTHVCANCQRQHACRPGIWY